MAVLSANNHTLDVTCSGRSFMQARNNMGPRTEPCGTPEDTAILSELVPFSITDYVLLSRKSLIQFRMFPPYAVKVEF